MVFHCSHDPLCLYFSPCDAISSYYPLAMGNLTVFWSPFELWICTSLIYRSAVGWPWPAAMHPHTHLLTSLSLPPSNKLGEWLRTKVRKFVGRDNDSLISLIRKSNKKRKKWCKSNQSPPPTSRPMPTLEIKCPPPTLFFLLPQFLLLSVTLYGVE